MNPKSLNIEDYTYELPDDKIAKYPLAERDASKLLVCSGETIKDDVYKNIAAYIPAGTLMVFNRTRVIHARLLFKKPSGSTIEIFCLAPDSSYPDIATAMRQRGKVAWKCLVGGAAKWKDGRILDLVHNAPDFTLSAVMKDKQPDACIIELSWNTGLTFAEVLHYAGKVPLPPYLHRQAAAADEERYQTIFATEEGSVAAPTAALHFTDRILDSLGKKGVRTAFVTLHVGAGTFMPVKSATMQEHDMHAEWMEVSEQELLLLSGHRGSIVAVGTTSVRTLESLYWLGCRLMAGNSIHDGDIAVTQWEPYKKNEDTPTRTAALQAILDWIRRTKREKLVCRTQILIAPGYRFRMIDGLVTNFHQPRSTLLLLVAALIGDQWRSVYSHALAHDYRFLSYGDGCLLMRREGSKDS